MQTQDKHSARRTVTMAVAALLMLALTAGPAAAVSADKDTAADPDRIDAWVEERMAAHGIPGTAVAVVRGGEVVHLAGYGTADQAGRPVTPATPFLIGSVSKPFTAAVIGQLVDEGLLSWDEPVWPHLSGLVEAAPEGFEEVTVEQLLTHTGGLGMLVGLAGAVEIHDGPDALDRRVADLLGQPLGGPPGEEFVYSNASAMLLAATAEQVTGRSFAEELGERVFDPLGMTGSFASEADPRAADLATGHQQWFGRWRPTELPYDPAGVAMGYIGSTAADLAAFMQAHLDGDIAAEIAAGPIVPTGMDTPLDAAHGRGWFVDELDGELVISHPGSLGHFTAHVVLVPGADDLGVAVLSNASAFVAAGHEGQYDLGLGLTRLLLDEDPQPTDPRPLMTLAVPVAAWAVVALLLGAIARHLVTRRRSCRLPARVTGVSRWARALLPGTAYIAAGTGLLVLPLGVARHFYPDVGWALTVAACIALAWGGVRLILAATSVRAGGALPPSDPPATDTGRTSGRVPVAA